MKMMCCFLFQKQALDGSFGSVAPFCLETPLVLKLIFKRYVFDAFHSNLMKCSSVILIWGSDSAKQAESTRLLGDYIISTGRQK